MKSVEPTRGLSPRLGLKSVLLLLIAWDVIGLLAELSFGGPLLKVSGAKIGGVLAARGSTSGALVVPLTLYVYAFIRGPLRYRGLLWIGVLEQSMVVVFAVYHAFASDVKVEGIFVPIIVSATLVVLLLVNMPRGQETS
jgi:hypothetical protein